MMYPDYLSDPAFEMRHFKIHVVVNAAKLATGGEVAESIMAKSESLGGVLTSAAGDALGSVATGNASVSNMLKGAQDMSQKMDQIFKKDGLSTLHTIVLPVPNSMQDSATHDWSVERGVAGEVIGALKGSGLGGLFAKGMAKAADMANMRKPLEDPGFFQSYAGTQPREFTFSFDLVPNNTTDVSNIYQIVQTLKKYSSPSTVVSHAIILSPHYFQIEIPNPYIDTLMMAKDVVLKSINVDYGADGYMQQTPDGVPKYMKLDMTFAERKMMTQEMYG